MPAHSPGQADSRTDLTQDCPTCEAAAGWVCRNVFNGRELPAERGTHYARQLLTAEGPSAAGLITDTIDDPTPRQRGMR